MMERGTVHPRQATMATWFRVAARTLALVLATALLTMITHTPALPEARDRVITYFDHGEWRIFDPVQRTDELFLKVASPRGIYWDTTESYVEYASSDSLFRIEWEIGAQPWMELGIPYVSDWWFNPDSLCWQGSTGGGVLRKGPTAQGVAPYRSCYSNLWQSDREGANWRIVRSDTVACEDCWFCEKWQISDSLAIRRHAAIGLNRILGSMTVDGWGGTPVAFPPPAGEWPSRLDWRYIPFRTAPDRGLALRIGHRPPNTTTFMVPLYLIDRRRGTHRLLETPHLRRDGETSGMGMAEHNGYLLVSGHFGARTYVYDLNTGDQIFPRPGASAHWAVWIKRPAPARVDTAGMRRLQTRFR